jgi:hypothetical protein
MLDTPKRVKGTTSSTAIVAETLNRFYEVGRTFTTKQLWRVCDTDGLTQDMVAAALNRLNKPHINAVSHEEKTGEEGIYFVWKLLVRPIKVRTASGRLFKQRSKSVKLEAPDPAVELSPQALLDLAVPAAEQAPPVDEVGAAIGNLVRAIRHEERSRYEAERSTKWRDFDAAGLSDDALRIVHSRSAREMVKRELL